MRTLGRQTAIDFMTQLLDEAEDTLGRLRDFDGEFSLQESTQAMQYLGYISANLLSIHNLIDRSQGRE